MILSRENLSKLHASNLVLPQPTVFDLPEKVLQFGTGVLLRGLCDYFIDEANRNGIFNGRVAVVKSTPGATTEFDQQDNLYTLSVNGIENGQAVNQNIVSSAISRVIAADSDWQAVLAIAASAHLTVVVSNTTEVGIVLVEESIELNPPKSFPAKLLAVLYHRYKVFKGDASKGLVVVATELIPDNGKKLGEIVLQLARFNKLEDGFLVWLTTANNFCNSLVDRIVPGKPDAETAERLAQELGYQDKLLTVAEPYRLWAIEGSKKVADVLSFCKIDEGVVIAEDIEIFRELKVRLLNGTHTLTSGVAVLLGIDTVKNAMDNKALVGYINDLMAKEIAPAIPYSVTENQTKPFANSVKDRFANPNIKHLWANIAFQYSMKMKIRVLPVLLHFNKLFNKVPQKMALGMAAYLVYSRVNQYADGKYAASFNGNTYQITDDSAPYLYEMYTKHGDNYSTAVLNDVEFWGADLSVLPGFIATVEGYFQNILQGKLKDLL